MAGEQEQTLEALRIAIRMEIDGKKYYQMMSESKGNKLGLKLFKQLAVEEDYHRHKFEEIYKTLEAKKSWPTIDAISDQGKRIKNIFSQAVSSKENKVPAPLSELEAVQKAMEMENKTRDYYQERSVKSSFEAEKKYYATLAGEESAHHAVLLDYYEYIKDPAGWFTVKEHHSLDGG
jgi:rubrerythrin